MYPVITIADEILRQSKAKGISITPMKLMKLVYIAHGWYLAIKGEPLFSERIEAWKYGPVIPDLYHDTKQFGRNPIPPQIIDDGFVNGVDDETKEFIDDVLSRYGDYSAFDLSSFTHQSGTPWDTVYHNGSWDSFIPDSLIQSHYIEKLNHG